MTERIDKRDEATDTAPAAPTRSTTGASRRSSGQPGLPLGGARVQAKLAVGPADDHYEREADAVASRVVRALRSDPSPLSADCADMGARVRLGADTRVDRGAIGHDADDGEGGRIGRIRRASVSPGVAVRPIAISRIQRARSIGAEGGEIDDETTHLLESSRSGGQQLPAPARTAMESAFGVGFGGVRVHADSTATELNNRIQAKAFTTGSDIYFRDGVPDVSTSSGQELLAHELTHVVQQGSNARRSSDLEPIQRKKGKKKKRKKKPQRAGAQARPPVQAPPATVPTADSAFTQLASLVDLAVPTEGDSGTLEASVKIPLTLPSTFLEFDLEGELERGDDGVEGGFDVAIGYGGAIEPFGLTPEIVGKLGGFVEAQAGNASEMLKLISYGFFRQFRETNLVPKELTNYLWGQGGETGVSAAAEADQWGADLEKQIFGQNPDAEVGVGVYGSVGASLGEEDALKGELSTKVSSATKYNKESLEASGSGGTSQLGKATKDREGSGVSGLLGYYLGRGAEKSVGEVERKLETELEVSYDWFEGAASFSIALQKPLEFELEVSGKGEVSASERKPVQIVETIVTALSNLRGIVSFLRANERTIGQYAAELGETADTIGALVDSYTTQKDELVKQLNGKIGGKGTRSVEVSWSLECEDGKLKPSEFSISYVTEVKAEGLGAEAKIERKRELASFKWPKPPELPTP